MRPIIFLDFDGVLNALQPDPDGDWLDWRRLIVSDGLYKYTLKVSARMCERLGALQEKADFVWCTTWKDLANTDLSPLLGFPGDWPVIQGWGDHVEWKLRGVQEFLEEYPDRSVVWIDDDLCVQRSVRKWATEQARQPVLLVAPYTTHGLSEADLRLIETWIESSE